MLKALSLYSFRKVFSISLLFSSAFFAALFFITRPNDTDMAFYISIGVFIVTALLSVFLFAGLNRSLAVSYFEKFYGDDEYTLMEVLGETSYYVVNTFLLVLTFFLAHNIIIPYIAAVAGGLFQVSVGGFEFNALTLVINSFCIVWLFLGAAQITVLDATFFETLSLTLQFVFNNFFKLIGFVLFILVSHLLFEMVIVLTYQADDPLSTLPIKVFVMAYLVAMCCSVSVGFSAEDAEKDEEEE